MALEKYYTVNCKNKFAAFDSDEDSDVKVKKEDEETSDKKSKEGKKTLGKTVEKDTLKLEGNAEVVHQGGVGKTSKGLRANYHANNKIGLMVHTNNHLNVKDVSTEDVEKQEIRNNRDEDNGCEDLVKQRTKFSRSKMFYSNRGERVGNNERGEREIDRRSRTGFRFEGKSNFTFNKGDGFNEIKEEEEKQKGNFYTNRQSDINYRSRKSSNRKNNETKGQDVESSVEEIKNDKEGEKEDDYPKNDEKENVADEKELKDKKEERERKKAVMLDVDGYKKMQEKKRLNLPRPLTDMQGEEEAKKLLKQKELEEEGFKKYVKECSEDEGGDVSNLHFNNNLTNNCVDENKHEAKLLTNRSIKLSVQEYIQQGGGNLKFFSRGKRNEKGMRDVEKGDRDGDKRARDLNRNRKEGGNTFGVNSQNRMKSHSRAAPDLGDMRAFPKLG